MKAVVKPAPGKGAELRDVPIPTPQENEVLVQVKATSICGTDVHIYNWDAWSQSRIKTLPQTLGHEFCGTVIQAGKNVRHLKEGDFVSAETHIPCGHCKQCLTGQIHICSNLKILGVDCNGSFAEYIAVPEIVAWKNPPELIPEEASVQEPLGNAVYCTLVESVTGKSVVIMGDGPTGLFAVAVARAAGATPVFLVGLTPTRLDIARKLKADFVINALEESAEKIILDETGGLGADVVLEMSGSEGGVQTGFRVLRKGGRFSAFGVLPDKTVMDINNNIVFKGSTVFGINGRLMFETWFILSNLLKYKRIDISPVITHRLPLEDFAQGFDLMNSKSCGKVILFPNFKSK